MKTITGDLISLARQGNFNFIVHGCNCFHVMGGGIARQLKDTYPNVFEADKTSVRGDRGKLGSYTSVCVSGGFTVINAYTQYRFGEDPEAKDGVLADYDAIRKAFASIKKEFGGQGARFGIPKIGAGLARGDWGTIEAIINEEMEGEDITLVLLPTMRGKK